MNEQASVSAEMPRYQCHKQVWALKIREVRQANALDEQQHRGGDWYLIPADERYGPVVVGHDEYYLRHKPVPGGYYVVYKDGYQSFSPAEAFEDGYTAL